MERWTRFVKSRFARIAKFLFGPRTRGAKGIFAPFFHFAESTGLAELDVFSISARILSWLSTSLRRNRGGMRPRLHGLILSLEAVAALSFHGDCFGYLQKCAGGVGEICALAVDQA